MSHADVARGIFLIFIIAGRYDHVDGIHLLSGIPGLLRSKKVSLVELLDAQFGNDFWPSTSAIVIRLQLGPGDTLSWTEPNVFLPGKAGFVCGASSKRPGMGSLHKN